MITRNTIPHGLINAMRLPHGNGSLGGVNLLAVQAGGDSLDPELGGWGHSLGILEIVLVRILLGVHLGGKQGEESCGRPNHDEEVWIGKKCCY
jgi:hypothetical protein